MCLIRPPTETEMFFATSVIRKIYAVLRNVAVKPGAVQGLLNQTGGHNFIQAKRSASSTELQLLREDTSKLHKTFERTLSSFYVQKRVNVVWDIEI